MLDAKLYCVFPFFLFWGIFYILFKKKKSFYTLPCCGQKAMGLLSTFLIVPIYAFLSYLLFFLLSFFFKQRRGRHIHCPTSLLDNDWSIFLAHAFASLMYTNWFISNQKQSCTLYTWSAFVSQSVCAGAFRFLVVVNCFVVGLFFTFESVTIC